MNEFIMNRPMMTLAQFLKATDFIQSGGQAKYFLKDYVVTVNNIECDKRGKKLYPKDIIKIEDQQFTLKYDQ